MSDYPNVPMGEDEEITDDAKLNNFYYNAGIDVYLEQEKELERKRDKVSDKLAKENTNTIVSVITIAVVMCIFWLTWYWLASKF